MRQIDGFNLKLEKAIDWFLCAGSVVMLAVNLAQVILRYVFHASILWSEELSTYLYVWIIFFSLYAACRERTELKIGIVKFANERGETIMGMIREICGLAACLALLAGSALMIKNALAYPQKTASLKIITAYLYFCMPICFTLLSWVKIINIVHDIRKLCKGVEKEAKTGGGRS